MPAGFVIPPACCTSVPPPLSRNSKKGAGSPARESGSVEAPAPRTRGGRDLPGGRAGETTWVALRARRNVVLCGEENAAALAVACHRSLHREGPGLCIRRAQGRRLSPPAGVIRTVWYYSLLHRWRGCL